MTLFTNAAKITGLTVLIHALKCLYVTVCAILTVGAVVFLVEVKFHQVFIDWSCFVSKLSASNFLMISIKRRGVISALIR